MDLYRSTKKTWWLDSLGRFSLILAFMGCQSTLKRPVNEQEIKLVDTNMELAQTKLDQGDPQSALLTLQVLAKRYPEDAQVLNMLGVTHLALGNLQKANQLFQKAKSLEPDNGFITLNLGASLTALGRTKEARTCLQPLLQEGIYEHKERVLHNIALSFEKERQNRRAVEFYKKALVENPVYYLSSLRLGLMYVQNSKTRSLSVKYLTQATQSCPMCFEPVAQLVSLYHKYPQSGSRGEGLRLLRAYLQLKQLAPKDKEQALALWGRVSQRGRGA